MEKTSYIPLFLFPIAVLPGEKVSLHIFEPRYREMIQFCLEGDEQGEPHPFGITFAQEKTLAWIGCLVRLVKVVQEYDDGRLDIVVQGEQRYKLQEVYDDLPYYYARVNLLDEGKGEEELGREAEEWHRRLWLRLQGELPEERPGEGAASFELARISILSPKQKQALLEMNSEGERLQALLRVYRKRVELLEEARLEKVQLWAEDRQEPAGVDHWPQ